MKETAGRWQDGNGVESQTNWAYLASDKLIALFTLQKKKKTIKEFGKILHGRGMWNPHLKQNLWTTVTKFKNNF